MSIDATTRSRRSFEYGFPIHDWPPFPVGILNPIRGAMGIPDSIFPGNALVISRVVAPWKQRRSMRGLGLAPFWGDQLMSSEVPIEIDDKPTSVTVMRELVKHLQDTIEALKREIARNRR